MLRCFAVLPLCFISIASLMMCDAFRHAAQVWGWKFAAWTSWESSHRLHWSRSADGVPTVLSIALLNSRRAIFSASQLRWLGVEPEQWSGFFPLVRTAAATGIVSSTHCRSLVWARQNQRPSAFGMRSAPSPIEWFTWWSDNQRIPDNYCRNACRK